MEYIAILTALNIEFNAVLKVLSTLTAVRLYCPGKYKIAEYRAGEYNILVVKTGCGTGNASKATGYLLRNYKIGKIINIGIAGALSADIDVGDVLVADQVISGDETVCYPDDMLNQELVNKLNAASLPFAKVKLLTAEKAVLSTGMRNAVYNKYKAAVVDMEASAVLRACTALPIPCACIKVISDRCSLSCFHLLSMFRNIKTAIKKIKTVSSAILL